MPRHKQKRSSPPQAAADSVVIRSRPRIPIGLAIVLLATCLVYLPALNGGRLWDDDAHITRPGLQSVAGLRRIWFDIMSTQQYYPMLHSAFWIEHRLWGDSVLGYHLINLFWHLLAVVLVYVILTRLKVAGALLAAAIFALHPVMVESVAWITEQKNTLSAVFYLSAMLAYLRFHELQNPLPLGEGSVRAPSTNTPSLQPSPKGKGSLYVLALGLFVLGLLTKTVTATLPAALLVIFWWQRGTLSWRRDVQPLIPFFVLGAAGGAVTAWVERTLVGAQGADFELSFLARSLLAGRVIWFYLGKLFWPTNLIFIYPRWTIDPAQAWQWVFSIAALAVTFALWAVRIRSRAPLAAWLFFCGTLFPVLGFLNVFPFIFSFVADHFQYLASLGIFALVASAVAHYLDRLSQSKRRIGVAVSVLFVVVLASLSWRQSHMYTDAITLYRTTLDRNPNCFMIHNNLGLELEKMGLRDEAVEHYRAALRIKPDYYPAHYNLGLSFAAKGQLQPAIDHLRETVRLIPYDSEAHLNLGNTLLNAERFSEAIGEYQAVLKLKPNHSVALTNLGAALAQAGRTSEAIECLKASVRLESENTEAQNNLGLLMTRSGDAKGAIPHLQKALQLRPDSADVHNNLGDALRQTDRPDEAIEHYQAALRLKPDLAQVYANLAQALAVVNRTEEAIASAQQAIKLANSAGQQEIVKEVEQWLTKYRNQLQHGENRPSSFPTAPEVRQEKRGE
jgi:protein O-mannosyl-transferase